MSGIKGHSGRVKGSKNRGTVLLKEAILRAAEETGDPNAKHKGGLNGYLKWLARTEPKSFAMLMAKTMPHAIEGGDPSKPVYLTFSKDDEKLC